MRRLLACSGLTALKLETQTCTACCVSCQRMAGPKQDSSCTLCRPPACLCVPSTWAPTRHPPGGRAATPLSHHVQSPGRPASYPNTPSNPAGLLLERASKLQSDRQQGGDALVPGPTPAYLYIKCLGECCTGRPLELHSCGGSIFSGNAFEAHAGRSARCGLPGGCACGQPVAAARGGGIVAAALVVLLGGEVSRRHDAAQQLQQGCALQETWRQLCAQAHHMSASPSAVLGSPLGRKRWRETIRVLPQNVSLKAWLASGGRGEQPGAGTCSQSRASSAPCNAV